VDTIQLIILSILIIFAGTTFGAALVFCFRKKISQRLYVISLGFASGIMVAAAFFGLLNPSIQQAKTIYNGNKALLWIPPLCGFMLGGLLLYALDKLVPHIHKDDSKTAEGLNAPEMSKNFKFFLAVTIHNIPEGLVTGFACGLALANINDSSLSLTYATSALALGIGIAIQNIPEGFAVSVPMYAAGMKKWKAFLYGSGSGVIEPILAVAGMYLASALTSAMPWFLSFGAGAMIYVTIDELLPDAHQQGLEHFGLWAFMIGFGIMMLLETLL
jgi:ZIP family zinc transporter